MATRLRGPGRPARLSHELIVATALEMDLERLTTRDLAARLGVSHSALYRWVDGREALMLMVADTLVERIMPSDDPVDGDWHGWLAGLGLAMRREFLAVQGFVGQLLSAHGHPPAYERLEARVVDVLMTDAGVASRELAVQCWYAFATSVVGWLAVEQSREVPLDPPPRFEVLLDALLAGLPHAAAG